MNEARTIGAPSSRKWPDADGAETTDVRRRVWEIREGGLIRTICARRVRAAAHSAGHQLPLFETRSM